MVWSLPPPGDSEGPQSFIIRAASLRKLDLPNLLYVQDTPNDRCSAELASTCSANASYSRTDQLHTTGDRPKIRDGKVANRPIYVALAVTAEGTRDILGLWAGDGGEGAKFSACSPN